MVTSFGNFRKMLLYVFEVLPKIMISLYEKAGSREKLKTNKNQRILIYNKQFTLCFVHFWSFLVKRILGQEH